MVASTTSQTPPNVPSQRGEMKPFDSFILARAVNLGISVPGVIVAASDGIRT